MIDAYALIVYSKRLGIDTIYINDKRPCDYAFMKRAKNQSFPFEKYDWEYWRDEFQPPNRGHYIVECPFVDIQDMIDFLEKWRLPREININANMLRDERIIDHISKNSNLTGLIVKGRADNIDINFEQIKKLKIDGSYLNDANLERYINIPFDQLEALVTSIPNGEFSKLAKKIAESKTLKCLSLKNECICEAVDERLRIAINSNTSIDKLVLKRYNDVRKFDVPHLSLKNMYDRNKSVLTDSKELTLRSCHSTVYSSAMTITYSSSGECFASNVRHLKSHDGRDLRETLRHMNASELETIDLHFRHIDKNSIHECINVLRYIEKLSSLSINLRSVANNITPSNDYFAPMFFDMPLTNLEVEIWDTESFIKSAAEHNVTANIQMVAHCTQEEIDEWVAKYGLKAEIITIDRT